MRVAQVSPLDGRGLSNRHLPAPLRIIRKWFKRVEKLEKCLSKYFPPIIERRVPQLLASATQQVDGERVWIGETLNVAFLFVFAGTGSEMECWNFNWKTESDFEETAIHSSVRERDLALDRYRCYQWPTFHAFCDASARKEGKWNQTQTSSVASGGFLN